MQATVTKQHRIGLSQISAKLSETRPYSHLSEYQIVADLSRGLAGERPFRLLPEAFLVDRQNYRLEALVRMLGYLGIENAENRIARHPRIVSFLTENWGESATLKAELKRFVDLRNEAAHDQVENTIGLLDFKLIVDLVEVVCLVLVEIMTREIVNRCNILGRMEQIGSVVHVYGSGKIPIIKAIPVRVKVGDEVAIVRAGHVSKSSIQIEGQDVAEVSATNGQGLGFRLDTKCDVGDVIARPPAEKPQLEFLQSEAAAVEETEEEIEGTQADGTANDEKDSADDIK